MRYKKKPLRIVISFLKKNYLVSIILLIILLVAAYSSLRLIFPSEKYIYAKIKLGPGYWWSLGAKPSSWYADSVKKGDQVYNLLGSPIATVTTIRTYPLSNQFDVIITTKLKVSLNKRTGEYKFNRSTLAIGAPIELNFSKTLFTGTVIELNNKPFDEKYVTKIIYLRNSGGYTKDFPNRYDSIIIGDKYFDGQDYVFEVLDKHLEKSLWAVQNNLNAEVIEREVDTVQSIVVKAKVKVREKKDGYYFADEYKLMENTTLPLATKNYLFDGYIIVKIE